MRQQRGMEDGPELITPGEIFQSIPEELGWELCSKASKLLTTGATTVGKLEMPSSWFLGLVFFSPLWYSEGRILSFRCIPHEQINKIKFLGSHRHVPEVEGRKSNG